MVQSIHQNKEATYKDRGVFAELQVQGYTKTHRCHALLNRSEPRVRQRSRKSPSAAAYPSLIEDRGCTSHTLGCRGKAQQRAAGCAQRSKGRKPIHQVRSCSDREVAHNQRIPRCGDCTGWMCGDVETDDFRALCASPSFKAKASPTCLLTSPSLWSRPWPPL